MEIIKFKLTGIRPLLMHNARLSDGTDDVTKELKSMTGNKKKTDDDLEQIKWVEWLGGLYLDEGGMIAIPADNVLATVIEGARKRKEGKNAAAGIFETAPFFKLEHDGSSDPSKLRGNKRFCDYRSVRVGMKRVMRARPIFRSWSVEIGLQINPEIINTRAVCEALEIAGERIGLGDYRPRYGRFTIEKI